MGSSELFSSPSRKPYDGVNFVPLRVYIDHFPPSPRLRHTRYPSSLTNQKKPTTSSKKSAGRLSSYVLFLFSRSLDGMLPGSVSLHLSMYCSASCPSSHPLSICIVQLHVPPHIFFQSLAPEISHAPQQSMVKHAHLWEQLVFPRNTSTRPQCEPV